MNYDLDALLQPGGHAREFMRAAPNGGDWVDGFCDQILIATAQTRVSDFITVYGAYAANSCRTKDGQVQLNVKWSRDRGWTVFIADTLDAAADKLWNAEYIVNRNKEEYTHADAEV